MARASAASKGLAEPSWRFTLQAPSYLAVMTYLDDEGMRRKVYEAFVNRATEEKHRQPADHAEHSGAARREGPAAGLSRFRGSGAGRPDGARRRSSAAVSGGSEAENGSAFSRKKTPILLAFSGKAELQPWDIAYYAEKQRAALYDFDEEALRPYFPLEQRDPRDVRDRAPAVWDLGGGEAGRAGLGSAREVLRDLRPEPACGIKS